MPEISASEYLNSLLLAYQSAQKVHGQAVADVVAAEIRRDEAQKAMEEALSRLEAAREKYSSNGSGSNGAGGITTPVQGIQRKKSGDQGRKKNVSRQPSKRAVNKSDSFAKKGGGTKKTQDIPTLDKESGQSEVPMPPSPPVDSTSSIRMRRTNSKRAPKIFTGQGQHSKAGVLTPLSDATNVLEIAKGRTRDWYDKNFDCEVAGLVKRFYRGAFGTKMHEKTSKVTVKTIVLSDEWNDLVNDTSQIQEMYIGTNPEKDSKPTMRDRAAEALVAPPQKEPIALFFAPRNSNGSTEIFYGGHWTVVDGKMLNPPRAVKGQPRQCLAKFAFAGVDASLVEALNKDS